MNTIISIEDIQIFFVQLLDEELNFHPDEDFVNYVNIDTSGKTCTAQEAEERNSLMSKCFDLCQEEGVDIYELALEIFLKCTGLSKYIPLPSSLTWVK